MLFSRNKNFALKQCLPLINNLSNISAQKKKSKSPTNGTNKKCTPTSIYTPSETFNFQSQSPLHTRATAKEKKKKVTLRTSHYIAASVETMWFAAAAAAPYHLPIARHYIDACAVRDNALLNSAGTSWLYIVDLGGSVCLYVEFLIPSVNVKA